MVGLLGDDFRNRIMHRVHNYLPYPLVLLVGAAVSILDKI